MTDGQPKQQAKDPHALLAMARSLIADPRIATQGLWPRAAALVGRQALEQAIAHRFPELMSASFRAQLICLPTFFDDPALAGDVALSWSSLGHATHFRGYDLPPTSDELQRWLERVERLLAHEK